MTAEIRRIVDGVIGIARVEPREIESVLGVKLSRVASSVPPVDFYEGTFPSGPFGLVDFRLNRKTGMALLVLNPRPGTTLVESAIDIRPYGPIASMDINPRIPPEGTQAFIQDAGGLRIAWQFTMRSRVLRLVSFDWPAKEPAVA